MQFRYQNEHFFKGENYMLNKTKAILVLAIALVAQTSSAYLTPGPSQPGRPAPYPGDPYPGNPYPGNPYPGNPPPNLDPYPPQQPPTYPPPNYGSCYRDLCVGTRVYNIQRSFREAEIVGIEHAGTYVLRFTDNGGVGGNWDRVDLAVMQGCGYNYCVGQYALNAQRNYRQVQIVAIQQDRRYVLRFLDNGGVGGNWTDSDLVRQ
jgi:hypothetical protein